MLFKKINGQWKVVYSHDSGVPTVHSDKKAAVDPALDLVAVKTVVDQYMEIMKKKDREALPKIFVHDPEMVNFGTDAAERLVGWTASKDSMEAQMKAIDLEEVAVRNQVFKIHPSGEVAWFSEVVDMKGKGQGQPFSVQGCRLTGVLEKRDGNWLISQFHYSVPVAGQVAKY
jgi:ketosteroid isomerase-like protein